MWPRKCLWIVVAQWCRNLYNNCKKHYILRKIYAQEENVLVMITWKWKRSSHLLGSNLSSYKQSPEFWGSNRIQTHDLSDTGVIMLFICNCLSYYTTANISFSIRSSLIGFLSYILHINDNLLDISSHSRASEPTLNSYWRIEFLISVYFSFSIKIMKKKSCSDKPACM